MPELKTYDLSISHAWAYYDSYYRLEELETEKNGEICARLISSLNVCGRGSAPPLKP